MSCFLCCNEEVKAVQIPINDSIRYECPNCGSYTIDSALKASLKGDTYTTIIDEKCEEFVSSEIKFKAACIAAERKLKGQDNFFLASDNVPENSVTSIIDFIKDFPENPIDRFNRALINLGKVSKRDPFGEIEITDSKISILFLRGRNQIPTIIDFFESYGYIKLTRDLCTLGGFHYNIAITPSGWARIAELQNYYKEHSNKAFLAMWFNDSTNSFRDAVKAGAEAAGYILEVVDEKHHNNPIMNQVLNMIDEAKFVIADFTCIPEDDKKENSKVHNGVRGGVYYEAGYAEGQGKEVIMTCKDNNVSKRRRHFDIDQINTIFWNEVDGEISTIGGVSLSDYIKERIIHSVGKGPGV